MPLKKTYDFAAVKAAIDRAEGHHFSSYTSVYGATEYDWSVQEFKDKTGVVRFRKEIFTGPNESVSSDVGHTYRNHVKGLQEAEYVGVKSRYDDLNTCIQVTREMLNSTTGQEKLESLDSADEGSDRKISVTISGDYYGDKGDSVKKKIERAVCIIMRLGTETLWVHTSYPTHFQS